MAKKPKVTQVMLEEVFDHWLSCEITKHRVFDSDMKRQVKKRLDDGYSVDDLKQWITDYSIIWKGEDYWYTHKWTLEDFMKRGFKKFRAELEPYKHFKKNGNQEFFSSPSGAVGSPPSDSAAPSPALKVKRDRYLKWTQATPEERKELAKEWGYTAEAEK